MTKIQLPLGGDVNQAFKFLTSAFSAVGSQFGFINIYNARSSAPLVEQDVLEEVGSYGKQLGRMADAMSVLLARLPADTKLSADEEMTLAKFRVMVDEINAIKESHGRKALRVG